MTTKPSEKFAIIAETLRKYSLCDDFIETTAKLRNLLANDIPLDNVVRATLCLFLDSLIGHAASQQKAIAAYEEFATTVKALGETVKDN